MNNFDSIEKLVEFGLGVSIAQQMVQNMNRAMQNTIIPGQDIPRPEEKEWYIAKQGKACGPLSEAEVKQQLLNKKIDKTTLVWSQGMATWQAAGDTPKILELLTQLPPTL